MSLKVSDWRVCLGMFLMLLACQLAGSPEIMAGAPEIADEPRSIYVGDIVKLSVSAKDLSAEQIREAFKPFEVVELKSVSGGFLASLRTFEVGEHAIKLGNSEIIIHVSSTLHDIQQDEIFEGDQGTIELVFPHNLPLSWRAAIFAAASVFLLSGIFVLAGILHRRMRKSLSPYKLFVKRSAALCADDDCEGFFGDDNYFVNLTFYFKEYIEATHKCRIIGKTSGEIVDELNAVQSMYSSKNMLLAIGDWLVRCDRYKFAGIKPSVLNKQEMRAELLGLVEKMDAEKEGVKA